MKEIKFNPIRIDKKTGKCIIASYSQWYKIKNASKIGVKLIIDDLYKHLPNDTELYNHKLKQLFFYDYKPKEILEVAGVDASPLFGRGINFSYHFRPSGYDDVFCCEGLDCDGTPAFSHYTTDHIANNARSDKYLMSFSPLTIGMMKEWLWWWIYSMKNVELG